MNLLIVIVGVALGAIIGGVLGLLLGLGAGDSWRRPYDRWRRRSA